MSVVMDDGCGDGDWVWRWTMGVAMVIGCGDGRWVWRW